MDRHSFGSGGIAATVAARGAELVSLRGGDGTEFLWQAGPEWPRHAPVLFPIVGRLRGDRYRHGGRDYAMTQHGFARDRTFRWLERGAEGCRLVLEDDAETRAAYPFAFRLEIAYRCDGTALSVDYRIANTGTGALPASLGAHPGFNWPLRQGVPKEAHRLEFERPEPGPLAGVEGGLLAPGAVPSPVRDRTLELTEELFRGDALVFDPVNSRSVRYTAPGCPVLEVSWRGFPQLGVWSKPSGAPFLCIEPWHGTADPVGFDGDLEDKPGMMLIPPGEAREMGMRVALG
ncbi:MAG TPA: aldose 1-epimerase family protein [Azospirillaceae bacterium]|nr:aldose 1-epimerase family protein [Azospirillaceae bacterium]